MATHHVLPPRISAADAPHVHSPADFTGDGPPHPALPPGRIEHWFERAANVAWYANSFALQISGLLRRNPWVSVIIVALLGFGTWSTHAIVSVATRAGVPFPGWLARSAETYPGSVLLVGTPVVAVAGIRRWWRRRHPSIAALEPDPDLRQGNRA